MKITIQWILAAIIVILLLLVGAYALTNGNNTPATNATATPTTTITPTATITLSPSAMPSTAASITPAPASSPTPTATPTISGSSGVRLTGFGYYITYPPFSDNDVHVNPNYVVNQGDVVYFDPTSASVTKYVDLYDLTEATDAVAVVHRSGNLSGTTHVTITLNAENLDDWYFTNVDNVDSDHVSVTFAPGESSKTIGIDVWSDYESSYVGHMYLTITSVDGVDSIGSNSHYTLTVNTQTIGPSPSPLPGKTVEFATSNGYLTSESGCDIISLDEEDGYNIYHVNFDVKRTGDLSGTYTPIVGMSTNIDEDDTFYILDIDPFQAGHDTTQVHLYYTTEYLLHEALSNPHGDFSLTASGGYSVGTVATYHLDLGLIG